MTLHKIADEVHAEIHRAWVKFGPQYNLPDGADPALYAAAADVQKQIVDNSALSGTLGWADILLEEVYEAIAEPDPARLRAELLQVAAVAMRWIDTIDVRARMGEGGAL